MDSNLSDKSNLNFKNKYNNSNKGSSIERNLSNDTLPIGRNRYRKGGNHNYPLRINNLILYVTLAILCLFQSQSRPHSRSPSSSTLSSTSTTFFFANAFDDYENKSNFFSKQRSQLVAFTDETILQPIKEKYEQLSPNGKFLSTAFVGFTTSRVAVRTTVKTTVKIAKVTGAAFIVSEVLHSAGILDQTDYDSIIDKDTIQEIKSEVTTKINQCRLLVRKHCNMENVKKKFDSCLEQDRIGTLGFTSGVVAALVL